MFMIRSARWFSGYVLKCQARGPRAEIWIEISVPLAPLHVLHLWRNKSVDTRASSTLGTHLIWLGTRQQLLKLDFALLAAQFPQITFLTSVRDLGVTLDNTLSQLTSLIYPDLASIIYVTYVQSDALFPCLYLSLWSMPLSVQGLIIVTPSSLAYQNPALAPLQSVLNAAARLIARIPRFSHISTFMTEQLHWFPLSARIHFKIIFLVYKAFLGLAPSYLCKLIMRPLSAISDCPLRSLVRTDLLVPRPRTSTSQQCAFASAGPLLWNCLPVKTRAQILSTSLSSTPRLLKSFPFPGAYRTGGRL